MSRKLLRRSLECEVRSIDEATRTATFVASTERPVSMGPWSDPEVLRMKGARLGRYLKNPVLLDSHNRWGLESVIGSCVVKVEGRQLLATATYAKTVKGENAWQLVKDKHVRAMSIGYGVNPEKVTRLRKGESDGEGESKVSGPASIVDEWELMEISNVPVPADEDAVRRSFYRSISTTTRRPPVAKNNKTGRSAIDDLYARAVGEIGARGDAGDADDASETDDERADGEVTCPECNHVFTPARAAADDDKDATTDAEPEKEKAAPKPKAAPAPAPAKRAALTVLRPGEELKRDILAITPRGLERVAEECILDGKTLEETRAALKAAQAKRFAPVGTPEPAHVEGEKSRDLPADFTDDVLLRSLEGLSD